MSILWSSKDPHRLFVVQVAYLRFERRRHGMPLSLPGKVLLIALRNREILLEMPVMQVPDLIHLVRVERRHLIEVLLVDVPEQVAVIGLDDEQADHWRLLELTNVELHGLDVVAILSRPAPPARRR